MLKLPSGQSTSQGLSKRPALTALGQGDHVRLLIELLQPVGPDLARRWLAALLLVPREEREALVVEIEEKIAEVFASDGAHRDEPVEVHVTGPAMQKEGYVEQVTRTYVKGGDASPPRSGSIGKAKKSTR